MASTGKLPGVTTTYNIAPTVAAANVVSNVYTNVCPKIRPEPFEPKVAKVVITDNTIVGTASSWNSRVYTTATNSISWSSQCRPSIPNAPPAAIAAIQIKVLFML